MLATTVSYLSLLENKRHNVVSEKQQDVQLSINKGHLEETKRHNIATEEFNWANLAEVTRHNKATEAFSWANLAETQRHNVVTEGINQYDAVTRRSQLAINQFEADTHRYAAIQNAGIGWANVAVNQGQLEVAQNRARNDYDIGIRNANSNMKQAIVAERRQAEEVRYHNLSNEVDQERNRLTEQQNALRSAELDWKKNSEQQKINIEKADMIWSNTLDTIDTGRKLFETIVDSKQESQDSKYIKKGRKKKK